MRVIPCEETLKWTTVEVGGGLELRVMVVAFCTAWTPVSDSMSTEHRYHTLQAAGGHPHQKDTQVTAEKMQSVTQSAVHNDRIGHIWPRPVWMCSFPDATQLLALSQCLFKASDGEAAHYLPPVSAARQQSW